MGAAVQPRVIQQAQQHDRLVLAGHALCPYVQRAVIAFVERQGSILAKLSVRPRPQQAQAAWPARSETA